MADDPAITGDPKKQDATPADQPAATGQPPADNAGAAGTGQGAPPDDPAGEVAKAQAEIERLNGELEQQKELQSQADKRARAAQRELARLKRTASDSGDNPEDKGGESASDEDAEERRNAEMQIARILFKPQYRPALEADPTLVEALTRDPLFLVEDFLDAKDAVEQTAKKLDQKAKALGGTPPAKPEPKKGEEGTAGGKQFNAGAANAGEAPPIKDPNQSLKEGKVDEAVETSIMHKLGFRR